MIRLPVVEHSCYLESSADERKELGHSSEVPVRVADLHVSHVGREERNGMVDVDSFAVPLQQSLGGKGVPEIIKTCQVFEYRD